MTNSNLTLQLEKQYCPPIDTATFLAILSDYDLQIPSGLQAARQVLDQVAESANAEEESGFDPTGTGGEKLIFVDSDYGGRSGAQSDQGREGHPCSATDITTLSHGFSALDLEGIQDWSRDTTTENESPAISRGYGPDSTTPLYSLDDTEKESVLIETFPGLKPFDIRWALKNSKGNTTIAIEDLLNQVFLEETKQRHRGVDGFSQIDHGPVKRKNKGKKKRLRIPASLNADDSDSSAAGIGSSKWESARRDVEFLSSRTNIPMQQITSLYHENGASIQATIRSIADAHSALGLENEASGLEFDVQELNHQFPNISRDRLLALVQLAYPSLAAAHELAKALAVPPPRSGTSTPVEIDFRLPTPSFVDAPLPKGQKSITVLDDFVSASHSSIQSPSREDYISLRNGVFNQASAAYRRGKSDHLMGGVAAYYASLGRSYDAQAKAASSAEADRLVMRQSTDNQLDLHGVNVKDAVRIAREYVTDWWVRIGRSGQAAYHAGYRIITGKGTHSEGGRGKLGPAVGAMLIREGWKVEVGSGAILVTGVASKR